MKNKPAVKKKLMILILGLITIMASCDKNEVIVPNQKNENLKEAEALAHRINNITGVLQRIRGRNIGSSAIMGLTGNGKNKFNLNKNGKSTNRGDDDCGYWEYVCDSTLIECDSLGLNCDSTDVICDLIWIEVECDSVDQCEDIWDYVCDSTSNGMVCDSVLVDECDDDWGGGDWNWGWESCATVTEIENPHGTFTIIEDYGDGCEEFGILVKGKITTTYTFTESSSQTEVLYEDYSFDGVTMNGTMTSSNTWNMEIDFGSVDFIFTFNSSFKEDIIFTYEDGSTDHFTSDMTLSGDHSQMIIDGTYKSENSAGDVYSSEITTPLVYSYSCNMFEGNDGDIDFVFVPVKGVENITHNDDQIVIDYGNGECDNIVTITENGETIEVDLGADLDG